MPLIQRVFGPRRRVRTVAAVSATVLGLLLVAALRPQSSTAVPVEGHTGWSFLLCKFKGDDSEPRPRRYYEELFTDAGVNKGGVSDYFREVSRRRMDLRGSVVKGWYTMDYTGSARRSAESIIGDCVRAAQRGGYTVPGGHRVLVTVNQALLSGGSGGRALLGSRDINQWRAAHEMLKAYGLNRSWSYPDPGYPIPFDTSENQNRWDQMSEENYSPDPTPNFGAGAIGLNGYHLHRLGWLARDRVVTYGSNPVAANTFTLTALETDHFPGTLLVRVPIDVNDPDYYFTVEYRRAIGLSSGIPQDAVVIHLVKDGVSVAQKDDSFSIPETSVRFNGVAIDVLRISPTEATVRVSSDVVDACKAGFVWREAQPGDRVCVSPTTRDQVSQDNDIAYTRWVYGPSGAHTCAAGFVWREAVAGDEVCVTPDRRAQAYNDNAAAKSRRVERDLSAFNRGPNRCKAGFVWREADRDDVVCVSPATKDAVQADNRAVLARWTNDASRPRTCVKGFVWREAFPADDTCVAPAQREQAAIDNRTARDRVANPNA